MDATSQALSVRSPHHIVELHLTSTKSETEQYKPPVKIHADLRTQAVCLK